jgi:serine/threonine protein kinase
LALQSGTMLGPYEIQLPIGSGGMGEVYRAIDTRLRRPVAIKVLHPELTASEAALDGASTAVTALAAAPKTDAGVTMGTLAYMSPEQLRGGDLDARSDVFSLGLVIYEMATGRRAFGGRTDAEISAAILYEEPPPPGEIVPAIPARLNDVILNTLEKDREDRCQTAADLRADLRRLKRELESRPSLAPVSSRHGIDRAATRSRARAGSTTLDRIQRRRRPGWAS